MVATRKKNASKTRHLEDQNNNLDLKEIRNFFLSLPKEDWKYTIVEIPGQPYEVTWYSRGNEYHSIDEVKRCIKESGDKTKPAISTQQKDECHCCSTNSNSKPDPPKVSVTSIKKRKPAQSARAVSPPNKKSSSSSPSSSAADHQSHRRKSRAPPSMDPAVQDPDLPPGWLKVETWRPTMKSRDIYRYSPHGQKFRSLIKAQLYVGYLEDTGREDDVETYKEFQKVHGTI